MLNDRHIALLEERGLDVELLVRLGVNACDRFGDDGIEIPYFENQKRVNAKFRTIAGEKKFSQEAGARKCFWNIDVLSDHALDDLPLIITEGEFDAIAAIQAGFPRAISVPDGAPAEEQGAEDRGAKYSYLADSKGLLRDVREIILATDSDGPGVNLLNDLAIRLGKYRCKWVRYPVGCKDLNDALRKYGPRGVTESLTRAQWMKVGGVYKMSELPPLPVQKAYDVGMVGLYKHYRVRLGDFVVVTGIPSHGKTSFVSEVTARMASVPHDWTVAIASFEQKPQTDHRRNLRTFYNRKLAIWQTEPEKEAADKWIDDHFAFIVPDEDDDVDLKWVLEKCQAAIVQYGAKIVVIDPWNELDHIRPPDMTLTEYTGFAIKQFRKLASKYQVHLIVVAHPTKMRPEKAGQPLPIPSLYDISDSAHWFNKADVGIVIHRQDETRTLIRIAKSRYHDAIGVPGDIEGMWIKDQARYEIITQDIGYGEVA